MSYVGKYEHGLADGRLDLACQRGSCLIKDKDEAHLREEEMAWEGKLFKIQTPFNPINWFGLKMTMYSSSSLPLFLGC